MDEGIWGYQGAMLVSRLEWLAPEIVSTALAFLQSAVEKTAGERELTAWRWLLEAVAAHPRHGAASR